MDVFRGTVGDVWRDSDGCVVCAIAQTHGAQVLLVRPTDPEEIVYELVSQVRAEHNLRWRKAENTVDSSDREAQNESTT